LSPQSFANLLRNQFYAGKLVVKGWQIDAKGAFEPIVSEETFTLVQSILLGRKPTTLKRRRTHPDFPLRHFVKCGECQRPLTASYSTGRSDKYGYYHCANGSCRTPNIPKQKLESEFLTLIERLQPKAEYLKLFKEIVLDVWNQRRRDTTRLVSTLEARIADLKAKRQRVIDAFLHERSIDRATYQEQFESLNADIA